METISNEDRYDVLERKLKEAESAIFGCRAMLNYCKRIEANPSENNTKGDREREQTSQAFRMDDGRFPGQLPDPNLAVQEEDNETCDT